MAENTTAGYSQLKITLDGFCLTAAEGAVTASPCTPSNGKQLWTFAADGTVKNKATGCLAATASSITDGSKLQLAPCSSTDAKQQFAKVKPTNAEPAQAVPVEPPTLVEAAVLQRLVEVLGESSAQPVRHVTFRGVRFAHAATTQLERYEVPSGGDWSIARTGAVFIENAEGIAIEDSYFDSVGAFGWRLPGSFTFCLLTRGVDAVPGGNGVFLSKYARNCTVTGNRFGFPGDSAVASVGVSNMADGTAETYPAFNTIANNWMHDIGTLGKQTSCYFQAVSGRNVIENNTCYNGPRAGLK